MKPDFSPFCLRGKRSLITCLWCRKRENIKNIKIHYRFPGRIKKEDEVQFAHGIGYHIYEKLGAHPVRSGHTNGVHFAVWAPNALRVSVAGDFNNWDGRMHPMEKHEESGIFELFIPQVKPGDIYKYEIKLRDGLTYLKADPLCQRRPAAARHGFCGGEFKALPLAGQGVDARQEKRAKRRPADVYL